MKKNVRIKPAMLGLPAILLAIFFAFVFCGKKMEITHLSYLSRENAESKNEYFIVSNPPPSMDSLLNQLSEYSRLLMPKDTVEKHAYYNHFYVPCEKYWEYYFEDACEKPYNTSILYDNLLIIINIQPACNRKKITIYKKWFMKKIKEITLPLEERLVD